MGRAQQLILEYASKQSLQVPSAPNLPDFSALWTNPQPVSFDTDKLADAQADFWKESLTLWQRFLDPGSVPAPKGDSDRRFSAPQWRDLPLFDLIRQSYQIVSEHMLRSVEAIGGLAPKQQEQLRFATRSFVEAMSPSNFVATNPQALEKIITSRGESLLRGMENLLADLDRGQLTHSNRGAFEVGRDLASTPGKVIHETPLYQLIQYAPTTKEVAKIPLVIFPPWINRFYILDLKPEKSFVRWAVAEGLSVFMVSWKSADESLAHITLDDYVSAQIDAIDTIRDLLGVEAVHAIGYCVAGTTLATTLAWLSAKGEAEKVASATFFTAQVDFADAGDLTLFVDDTQLDLAAGLAGDKGYLDGRYMAATFNLLRGKDLIWNYVVQNYLMGEDHTAFDLLHWNGDVTNLPAGWHQSYLRDLYRDNLLAKPGALTVMGVPIDLSRVATPAYVQAGREDHIAPPQSVWKITEHFRGPLRFVLAGSGHIAGVVNPPASGKYQYWTSDAPAETLDQFVAAAKETKGSWWPHWRRWIADCDGETVSATRARIPGKGRRKAIEDAPGRYVIER
ncbi:class I poly(R)-hydroxyalkanoic acid synthase [Sphingomonas sp. CGMCC 1.13654]|uniref:Class I poly(R)-hydroxyalkanoic acid synthase n=1 Tax=Sphingomonas chungangi TaxID=2683589 RepID=A0A838L4K1_9SPHN|nr:class I poly(R)-hydroxyalkanoic acid synthase [Sphingomonas chungangi]MBA2932578.1 class I poly(R)-hydroxyalkanoic acid synthase [Sphingomonas chungangi]MVW56201.1 class I poly(R)-hydroxyalkanoic acid synthase [Sphingomonas chungangi]